VGGLWEEGFTGLLPNPDEPWDTDTPGRALAFWESLVSPPES
jgi:hypothetical protein